MKDKDYFNKERNGTCFLEINPWCPKLTKILDKKAKSFEEQCHQIQEKLKKKRGPKENSKRTTRTI